MHCNPTESAKKIKHDNIVGLRYLKGKFSPTKHKDFRPVPAKYSIRQGLYLHRQALAKFILMAKAAKLDGVELFILSATRNFYSQKGIWQAKFQGRRKVDGEDLSKTIPDEKKRALRILRWSSMPGTSRHHWGTDFDIAFARDKAHIALTNKAYTYGKGLKAYQWLRQNSHRFGFCQPYHQAPDQRSQGKLSLGYYEEKWHWSYKPLAKQLLAEYVANINSLKPEGFTGAGAGRSLYKNYVLNIAKECQ